MKIVFAGGGTLGSVTPLLAVWEECASRGDAGIWIGTRNGPEREFVIRAGLPFFAIFGGKFRRYFHWRNFFDPLLLIIGIAQSFFLILRHKPDVVINAGSYIGVPVIIAGSLLGKRCVIFQLDIEPSISNLIVAPFAVRILASSPEAASSFNAKKTSIVGIPASRWKGSVRSAREAYGIHDNLPILFVLGGGTGAFSLNQKVWDAAKLLTQYAHVIHITGVGKEPSAHIAAVRYHPRPLVNREKIADLFAAADCVVSRAGMGTIAELAKIGTATILVPLPHSHQEKNAAWVESRGAARYVQEDQLTPEKFEMIILRLLDHEDERALLSRSMKKLFPANATENICDLLRR